MEVRNRCTQTRKGKHRHVRGRGGVKRVSQTTSIEANVLTLSEKLARAYASFIRNNRSWTHKRSRYNFGYSKDEEQHKDRDTQRQAHYVIDIEGQREPSMDVISCRSRAASSIPNNIRPTVTQRRNVSTPILEPNYEDARRASPVGESL